MRPTGPGSNPPRRWSRPGDALRRSAADRGPAGPSPVQSPRDPPARPPAPRGLDRRGRPHADRPLRGRARERPAGRSRRRRPARGRRSRRPRPGARRGRHPRLREPGRRGQPQRGPDGAAPRRFPGRGRRADRQPAVRVGAAGDQLGGPRDRGRRRRRVHRRRRRIDDPRAVRPAQGRVGLRPRPARDGRHDPWLAVRQPAPRRAPLPVLDGRDGGERRRALGRQPRAPGCVRTREPAARRRRHRGRPVRRPDRADLDPAAEGRTARRRS